MNDLGSLATDIVTYSFPSDTGRFPVSFVSGWLQSNIGQFNGLSHEEFYIDETGAFAPSGLLEVEKSIFSSLYAIYYYERASREALRGVIWDGTIVDSITMVKEGDSTIQKVSKHQMAKTFRELAEDVQSNLDKLIFQYTRQKSSPIQVAGEDGTT